MTRGQFYLLAVSVGWVLGADWLSSAHGQQAMPPSGPIESVAPWSAVHSPVSRQAADPTYSPPGSSVSPSDSVLPASDPVSGDRAPDGGGPLPNKAPAPSLSLLDETWSWQLFPEGLLYKAYLASGRESRLGTNFVYQRTGEWTWDPTIGAHVGLLRYGSLDSFWPEGWQADVEAAVFPRIRLDELHTMVSIDFRLGVPLTWRRGRWEWKFGYYHDCSHLGDEYMTEQQSLDRINYMRDSLLWGVAVRPARFARLYAEAEWAFVVDDGSKPWHFQFGVDLSSAEPNRGLFSPFLAINARLREEVDYSGSLAVQTGLQWRTQANRLLRVGLQYFNGLSDQCQFYNQFEEQIGFGIWYDY